MTNPVTPTPIAALPPAPLVTDTPAQFDEKAFPFAAALDPLRIQINAQSLQTNQNAVAAKEGAAAAATSETAAAASETAAAASETAAAASETAAAASDAAAAAHQDWMARRELGPHASFPTLDNQGRPLIVGAQFLYTGVTPNAQYVWDGAQWIIGLQVTAGVTQINGVAGALSLRTINGTDLLTPGDLVLGILTRKNVSGSSIIAATDLASLIEASVAATITFSSLGAGWWSYARNASQAAVMTINAVVNGVSGWTVHPGQMWLIQYDGSSFRAVLVSGVEVLVVEGQKPSGTAAEGVSTSWANRDLNTVLANSINGASLSSNTVTLPPGIFDVTGSCPADGVNVSLRARLWDITGAAAVVIGSTGRSPVGDSGGVRSLLSGRFSTAVSKTFSLQNIIGGGATVPNGGVASGITGLVEVYSQLIIKKVG